MVFTVEKSSVLRRQSSRTFAELACHKLAQSLDLGMVGFQRSQRLQAGLSRFLQVQLCGDFDHTGMGVERVRFDLQRDLVMRQRLFCGL